MFPDLIGELERELNAFIMGKNKNAKKNTPKVFDFRIIDGDGSHDGAHDIDITFTDNIVDSCVIMGGDNEREEPLVCIRRNACSNEVVLTEKLVLEVADFIRAHRSKRK